MKEQIDASADPSTSRYLALMLMPLTPRTDVKQRRCRRQWSSSYHTKILWAYEAHDRRLVSHAD